MVGSIEELVNVRDRQVISSTSNGSPHPMKPWVVALSERRFESGS
jgi:hypothetical protein